MNDPSLFQLLVIGGLASTAGYLLRVVQKYEDTKDKIFFENLPTLYYNIYSYKEVVKNFAGDNLQTFKDNIKKINNDLALQVFSGNILLFERDLQKELLEFYAKSKEFEANIEQLENNEDTARLIKFAFGQGKDIPGTKSKELTKNAEDINNMIQNKLNKYISFSLILMIVIFLLGAALGVIEFIKK